jgi:DNA primase
VDNKNLQLEKVLNYYNIPIESSKYKILCPFHDDVNESLLVDLEEGRWFCFGCQRGGEARDFVKTYEKLNDFESYQFLYKILNDSKAKGNYSTKKMTKKERKIEKRQNIIMAKDYYYNLKTIDWRKDEELVSKEKEYLLNRGFDVKTLNKVKCKATYNNSYPIIFPMNDMGVFKGYVCRTMDSEIEKKRKYLYNKGFSRRNTLVGKYDSKTVMVTEGFMDYLKAKQFGVKYVVALLGWKATNEQIEKLKNQGVVTIISALDADDCGQKGTEYLSKHFKVIRFQYPKDVKDLGDMNKRQFQIAKYKTKIIRRKKENGFIEKYEGAN